MTAPEDRDPPPEIIGGRRVRCTRVHVAPDVVIDVLEAADADVVIDEAISDDGDAYAAILWPAAVAAAGRLPLLVSPGCTVLDLGAGTGLVALTAATLGAHAIAADHDEFARAVIAASAARLGLDVSVIDLDVSGDEPLPRADLVVIADLLYEPDLARAAAHRALEARAAGMRVLIADPGRFSRTELERVLARAGVSIEFEDALVHVPGEAASGRVGVAVIEPAPESVHPPVRP